MPKVTTPKMPSPAPEQPKAQGLFARAIRKLHPRAWLNPRAWRSGDIVDAAVERVTHHHEMQRMLYAADKIFGDSFELLHESLLLRSHINSDAMTSTQRAELLAVMNAVLDRRPERALTLKTADGARSLAVAVAEKYPYAPNKMEVFLAEVASEMRDKYPLATYQHRPVKPDEYSDEMATAWMQANQKAIDIIFSDLYGMAYAHSHMKGEFQRTCKAVLKQIDPKQKKGAAGTAANSSFHKNTKFFFEALSKMGVFRVDDPAGRFLLQDLAEYRMICEFTKRHLDHSRSIEKLARVQELCTKIAYNYYCLGDGDQERGTDLRIKFKKRFPEIAQKRPVIVPRFNKKMAALVAAEFAADKEHPSQHTEWDDSSIKTTVHNDGTVTYKVTLEPEAIEATKIDALHNTAEYKRRRAKLEDTQWWRDRQGAYAKRRNPNLNDLRQR